MEPNYISHIAEDGTRPLATACGEPWQQWQAPDETDPENLPVPPDTPPIPHKTEIRFCGACRKIAVEKVTTLGFKE